MSAKGLLAAVALAALSVPALAAPARAPAVSAEAAWTRPAQTGMNGVGFMTLVNTGSRPVTLVSARTEVARTVEIHRSTMTDGVMSMRRQDAGVEIPAGARVDFAPGGLHFMLLGLKQPLAAGQKIPVTLVFDQGRQLTVQLAVRTTAPQAAQGATDGHAHHE